jgi:hypothetical protein
MSWGSPGVVKVDVGDVGFAAVYGSGAVVLSDCVCVHGPGGHATAGSPVWRQRVCDTTAGG